MLSTDVLSTVFTTSGVSSVIGAFAGIAQAGARTATKLIEISAAGGLATASLTALGTAAFGAMAGVFALGSALSSMMHSYAQFGKSVREVMQLTGSSAQEAAYVVNLGRAAGLPDTRSLQEVLKIAKGFNGGAQGAALGQLGIGYGASGNGIQTLNMVIDRLNTMQNGYRKTAIEEQLFGARGAVAFQDVLALTKEQREQIAALSSEFSGNGLQALQRYQAGANILGMTIEQKIIFPIAEKLLPVLTKITQWVGFAVEKFLQFDKATGGLGTVLLIMLGLGVAIGLMVVGLGLLAIMVAKAVVQLRAMAAVQMLITALKGPAGIATVVAAVAITGAGLYAGNRYLENEAKKSAAAGDHSATGANTSAINANTAAVNNMNSTFQAWKGVPSGLRESDIIELQRRGALGALA